MDSVDPRSLHLFDKQPSLSLSPAAAWYFRSICRTLQVKGSLSEFLAVKGKGHNLSHELLSVDTSHVESPKMTRDHWISVPSTWQASWRKMLLCLCCIISSSTSEQVVLFSWDCSYELRRHRCHLLFRCLNVTSEVSDTHGKLDQVLCDAGWLDLAVFNGSQHGSDAVSFTSFPNAKDAPLCLKPTRYNAKREWLLRCFGLQKRQQGLFLG